MMHVIGASIAFLGGTLYQWLQTIATIHMHRLRLSDHVGCGRVTLRVLLALASTLIIILTGELNS